MTNEEKKAVERLDYFEPDDLVECAMYRDCVETIKYLIENQQKEIAQKDNMIDAMAEQLTTPVHNKQWVIDYFEGKTK